MQRQRVSGDYLQTSAVIEPDGEVRSAVSDPNRYAGPGTGWVLDGERWERLQALPHVLDPRSLASPATDRSSLLVEIHDAEPGSRPDEVVIAVGPAFGDWLRQTINDLLHETVLGALVEGVREGGASPRLVRVRRSSDVAFIGHDGALLAGSGVAVGLQSKGTAIIHRSDLQPLDNLELFGMSPLYTVDSYRAIGRNAAGYALGRSVGPVPTALDNFARAKLIVRTTVMHALETDAIVPDAPAVEVELARLT
jgi:propanediol dehydratase large subunit